MSHKVFENLTVSHLHTRRLHTFGVLRVVYILYKFMTQTVKIKTNGFFFFII